jgi:hypothetical protein
MTKLLKGNFQVKQNIEVPNEEKELNTAAEFRKKALESIGGSMVFVERKKLLWDDINPDADSA